MKNFKTTTCKRIENGQAKPPFLIQNKIFRQTEYNNEEKYERTKPYSESQQKAEELFSSFTGSIIKEETLFIR